MAMPIQEFETLSLADGTSAMVSKTPGMGAEEWKELKKYFEENPEEARRMEAESKDASAVRSNMRSELLRDYYQSKLSSGDEAVSSKVFGLEKNPEFAHVFDDVKRGGAQAALQHSYNEPLMIKVSKFVGGVPADVKAGMDKIQSSPITLQEACKMGDLASVEAYLKATEGTGKRDLEAPDSKGATCLGYAVGANRVAVVKLLLDKKADASKCDSSGSNAVHYAAAYGRKELLTFLIDGKMDLNAKNAQGLTPLALATKNKQKDAIELLKSKGGAM